MFVSARYPEWLVTRPIAHRGLFTSPDLPENSRGAFKAAIQVGVPIELDVHLLADGHPVVLHDHDLTRLTGKNGLIQDLNREEVRALNLLGTAETVPLFVEVLELVAGAVPLLIEIKSHRLEAGALEEAVLDRLRDYRGDYALQSFHMPAVDYLRRHAPTLCRGQLSDRRGELSSLRDADPDFISYSVDGLPDTLRAECSAQGLALLAWTVRTTRQFERAGALADNIIFEPTPEVMSLLAGSARRTSRRL